MATACASLWLMLTLTSFTPTTLAARAASPWSCVTLVYIPTTSKVKIRKKSYRNDGRARCIIPNLNIPQRRAGALALHT